MFELVFIQLSVSQIHIELCVEIEIMCESVILNLVALQK